MSSAETVKGWVAGRVQGVAFRASLKARADQLGLSGWVRNLADGRLEFVVAGPGPDVDALLGWARVGPGFAKVDEYHFTPSGAGDEDELPFPLEIRF